MSYFILEIILQKTIEKVKDIENEIHSFINWECPISLQKTPFKDIVELPKEGRFVHRFSKNSLNSMMNGNLYFSNPLTRKIIRFNSLAEKERFLNNTIFNRLNYLLTTIKGIILRIKDGKEGRYYEKWNDLVYRENIYRINSLPERQEYMKEYIERYSLIYDLWSIANYETCRVSSGFLSLDIQFNYHPDYEGSSVPVDGCSLS